MVGHADNDGVDILARKNFSVVTGGEDVVAPDFLAVLEPSVVAIRHGDELHARNLQRHPSVSLSLATSANQRDLNVVVGQRRGGSSLNSGQRMYFCCE